MMARVKLPDKRGYDHPLWWQQQFWVSPVLQLVIYNAWSAVKFREVFPRGMAQIMICISKEGLKILYRLMTVNLQSVDNSQQIQHPSDFLPPHLTDIFLKLSPLFFSPKIAYHFFRKMSKKMRMVSTSVTKQGLYFNIVTPTSSSFSWPWSRNHASTTWSFPRRLLRFSNTAMTRMAKELSKAACSFLKQNHSTLGMILLLGLGIPVYLSYFERYPIELKFSPWNFRAENKQLWFCYG